MAKLVSDNANVRNELNKVIEKPSKSKLPLSKSDERFLRSIYDKEDYFLLVDEGKINLEDVPENFRDDVKDMLIEAGKLDDEEDFDIDEEENWDEKEEVEDEPDDFALLADENVSTEAKREIFNHIVNNKCEYENSFCNKHSYAEWGKFWGNFFDSNKGLVTDEDVAMEIIVNWYETLGGNREDYERVYNVISSDLFEDKDFIMDVYETDPPLAIEHIVGDLSDDKEFLFELMDKAIEEDDDYFDPARILNGASDKLRNDKKFMLEAIKKISFNWYNYSPEEFAGEELKADHDYQEKLTVLIEERQKAFEEYEKGQEKNNNPADPEG